MAAEVPLENTLNLAANIRTLAGEKEIADLEAIASGVPLAGAGNYASKLGAMRDATLTLAQSIFTTLPQATQARAVAISKLREFFIAAREAVAAQP